MIKPRTVCPLTVTLTIMGALALGPVGCGSDDDPNVGEDVGEDVSEDTADDSQAPDTAVAWECLHDADSAAPDFLQQVGCESDFLALASVPLDASIPGARSLKTVLDRFDDNALFFQNSTKYKVHYDFCLEHRNGDGLPPIGQLNQFNTTEYYSPSRRFVLGALTFYDEPGVWVYELSPYDTATADLIQLGYEAIAANTYFGDNLYFHPTSTAISVEARKLPDSVKIITTDELFAGITFQPLNLATSMGKLRFVDSAEFVDGYLDPREIVVLDAVPNDIGVVSGIITAELQTPLSHINVLSQNRGTPNMALKGAFDDAALIELDGKWVELTVGALDWSIREVTLAEADAWWEDFKPEPLEIGAPDLSVTELRDIEDVTVYDNDKKKDELGPALAVAIPAFGGKASHYSAMTRATMRWNGGEQPLPIPKAWAIPIFYYDQHMTDNGLKAMAEAMLADTEFKTDAVVRAARLKELRDAIRDAPINEDLMTAVLAKLAADYPGIRMRFRSSTNAEDLDGFTGAGLYTSRSGDPNDPDRPVDEAIKRVWASIWNFKAYEEREFRGISHTKVGMAILSHRSFPDEEANGVAVTGNLFDLAFLEPAFIINVQKGEASVVKPEPGETTDYFQYFFTYPGQPQVFLSHSNLVHEGETVLTPSQTFELGSALDGIHTYFRDLYGSTPGRFYGMDVEFKFDGEPGEEPALFVKQARPHPGWGAN